MIDEMKPVHGLYQESKPTNNTDEFCPNFKKVKNLTNYAFDHGAFQKAKSKK
jgi:hypothetical protein